MKKQNKQLSDYSYEIIDKEENEKVDNLTIMYKLSDKDEETILEFISLLRKDIIRPTNITIVDSIKANTILQQYTVTKFTSPSDSEYLKIHWIALSTFEGLNLMYPEK